MWQRSLDETYGSNNDDERSASPEVNGSEVPSMIGSPSRRSMISEEGSIGSSAPVQTQHALPALFADAGWDKLNNTILSTSNCGNPSLRHFGFGPTTGEGFGIGYIIKDGSVSICASSKHRQTKRFIDALEAYFLEVRKLLRQIKRRGTSTDKNATRAREAEEKRPKSGRMKSRGRMVVPGQAAGIATPKMDEMEESDEDGLGGCRRHFPISPSASFVFEHGLPTPQNSPPRMVSSIMGTPPPSPGRIRGRERMWVEAKRLSQQHPHSFF